MEIWLQFGPGILLGEPAILQEEIEAESVP